MPAKARKVPEPLWLRGALSAEAVATLIQHMSRDARPGARVSPEDALFDAIETTGVNAAVRSALPSAFPVRLVTFAKSDAANWGVPWHQDRVIALRARAEVPGYEAWTQKNGIWHCEPPLEILQEMLFVRVHLDEHTPDGGAMEIALGSHERGVVGSRDAERVAADLACEVTRAAPGDILILPMLTLHRSLPATRPTQRRVLRIDYACAPLPAPLEWAVA